VEAKAQLTSILKEHFADARKTFEVFNQFAPILNGSLSKKVMNAFRGNLPEDHYTSLVKEIKYYQSLARLLPLRVSLPLFEVDLTQINGCIRERCHDILSYLFTKFEETLLASGKAICLRYLEISLHLRKTLTTVKEAMDMDLYKSNLILEMTQLRERVMSNRRVTLFLLRNDQVFKDETWELIRSLYNWPY
jgi:hypothetical protein